MTFILFSSNTTCPTLTHWASENEKLIAQQENLLVPGDQMALFLSALNVLQWLRNTNPLWLSLFFIYYKG